MNQPDQELIEKAARRAAGISALRKIGRIVADEQRADADKEAVLRWFVRYGWLVFLAGALVLAYFMGVI